MSVLGRRLGPRGAAIATVAFALLGAFASPAAASAPVAHASIVGGRAGSIEEFPALSYVEARQGKHGFACTGTVVAPRVVLTAAHCVEDIEHGVITPPDEYALSTGVADPTQATPENVFKIVADHVFPGFDPGDAHGDAGILVLERPTAAPPLALAGEGDAALYAGGTPVRVAGWGVTRGNARNAPHNFRSATMTVQSAGLCQRQTRTFYGEFSPAAQLCLLEPQKSSGACFGDSGGPAIGQRADGTPVELGITSIVGPSCDTKLPNVLTRADLVSSWVAEWVAAVESGAPPPSLAAPLPMMTSRGAEQFLVYTLLDSFGRRFERAKQAFGRCERASRTRFRCQIAWVSGADVYAGVVSPFYVRRQQTTAWDSHYRIEWARLKCIRASARHRRCAIHRKRG